MILGQGIPGQSVFGNAEDFRVVMLWRGASENTLIIPLTHASISAPLTSNPFIAPLTHTSDMVPLVYLDTQND